MLVTSRAPAAPAAPDEHRHAAPAALRLGSAAPAPAVAVEGSLTDALRAAVAARADARWLTSRDTPTTREAGTTATLQRVVSIAPRKGTKRATGRYSSAGEKFEVLRGLVSALRERVDGLSTAVQQWLESEVRTREQFITNWDGKRVEWSKRDDLYTPLVDHIAAIKSVKEDLPARITADFKARQTEALERATGADRRVATSMGKIAKLGKFVNRTARRQARAKAAAVHQLASGAPAVAVDEPGLSTVVDQLDSAESNAAALDEIIEDAERHQEFRTRRQAVNEGRAGIENPVVKAHMLAELKLLGTLSRDDQMRSLSDPDVPHGLLAVELELELAQEVNRQLSSLTADIAELPADRLFEAWLEPALARLAELTWDDLVLSLGDPDVEGIQQLQDAVVVAQRVIPRLDPVHEDIARLGLAPLRSDVEALAGGTPASWAEQVIRMDSVEEALAFAKSIEDRRAAAEQARDELTNQTQQANITGWLEANAPLDLAGQRAGSTDTHTATSLGYVEAKVAEYNRRYQQDLDSAELKRRSQLAEAGERRVRREAEAASTRYLLGATNKSAALLELDRTGVITRGAITETYRSSYDRGPGEFSAEYTIGGLSGIVIHAHCTATGTAKPGNAVHWKEVRYKHLTGPRYNHHVPDELRPKLLDATQMKNNRDANTKINRT